MEDIQWAADFLGGDYDFWSGTDPYDQGFTIHTKRVWGSGTSSTLYYNASSYPGRTTVPSSVSTAWINKADEAISTVINNGVSIVLHRDHGSTSGWGDPSFTTTNAKALINGVMTPVVFSINCETGWFDSGDYFGEAWVRNTSGGAVAFTGAVRVSYSGENDSFFVGLLDCMYNEFDSTWQSSRYSNSWHVGQMLNYAKDRVFAGYGSSNSYALLTARLHTLFGDPEMQIRTATPTALTVTHNTVLYKDSSQSVAVTVLQGGVALAGALVCLSKGDSSDYWVGTTDANGQVVFSGATIHELGYYDLVVTSRNAIPYQTTLQSVSPVMVALPSSVMEGSGVVSGTVTLFTAATADLVVAIQSSNASAVTVPTSVTIAAGQTSATFNMAIADDALLNGTRNVQVTASASGYGETSATIKVWDNETATLSVTLPASSSEGAGTLTGQGVVTISRAPDADVVVTLISSDTTELTVPTTVTILAGHTSATFDLNVVDDTLIDDAQTATVTSRVENWTDGAALITIGDNDRTLAITLSESWEGQGTRTGAGTVTIGGTLTSNLVVTLTSSDTTELTVPTTVTILAGYTSATFNLTIADDSLADGSQSVVVTAAQATFAAATATMIVHDNEVDHFDWNSIGTSQVDGVAFTATVRAKNIADETILVYSSTRTLSGAGSHGAVSLTPTSCTFASGVWTGSVKVNTVDTQIVLTITDGAGHSGSSNAFNVVVGAVDHLVWDTIAATQYAGIPFTATVKAVDVNGYLVSSYTDTATLSANDGAADSVTGTGTSSWNFPLYTYYHDARTQVIYLASELGGAGVINSLSLYVVTVPGQTMKNWTIRMKSTSLSSYSTYSWEGASSGWNTVYQADQTISSTGWVTFTFATPYYYNGTDNLMVDFSFNNSSWTSAGATRYTSSSTTRTIYAYTDSGYGDPLTWSGTSSPSATASSYIPNLRLNRTTSFTVSPAMTGTFAAGVWTGSITLSTPASQVYLFAQDSVGHTGTSNAFAVSANLQPTVATPAVATPNPVTGATTSLSVLGDDDSGESNLTYTWSVTACPAGVSTPTFSVNGTNAAKHTTATFYNDGDYSLLVTITDQGGLTTTSSVTVSVGQTSPTSLSIIGGTVVATYGGTTAVAATLASGGTPLSGRKITFSLNGTTVGDATTDANGVATLSALSLAGINAGSYTAYITVTFAGDSILGASIATADLSVNKATLISNIIVAGKVYDGTTTATIASRTLSGVMGSDDVTLTGGAAAFTDKNVGTAKTVIVTGLTLTGTTAANYTVSDAAIVTANITQASLTVTANSLSRPYGTANPTFTASYTGFVGGETLATSGVAGSPALSTAATPSSPAGIYTITAAAGTLDATNYGFVFVSGTLTVILPTVAATSSELTDGTVHAGNRLLSIEFNTVVVGADAATNYELRSAGIDGLLGTADDLVIAVSAAYSGTTAALSFSSLAEDLYRLTIRDTITDIAGNRLDGDGDGVGGGEWIQDFVVLENGGVATGTPCLANVGVGNAEGRGIAIQADGKILVAGSVYAGGNNDFLVTRYNADGSLDASFGTNGKVITAVTSSSDYAYAVTIQSDGKILLAGYANGDFALVRYNSDGSLDTTFSSDGKVTTAVGTSTDYACSVAVGADGKIVAAGYAMVGSYSNVAVVRYNSDGSLDTTFSADGKVTTAIGTQSSYAYGVAIQSDGKIVAAGYAYMNSSAYDFALVRYSTDGSLDSTFGSTGIVTTTFSTTSTDYAYALAIQSDGKLVAAGYTGGNFGLARYNSDGSLDTTFGTSGKVTTGVGTGTDYAYALALQSDGKIVAAGYAYVAASNNDFALVRYNAAGSLDTTFGTGGKVITPIGATSDMARAVAIQSGGQIVVAGMLSNTPGNKVALARYTSTGILDTTFGTAGSVTTSCGSTYEELYSIATQSDGKTVAVGSANYGGTSGILLIRYNANGTLDTGFGTGGIVTTSIGTSSNYGRAVILQSDGRIVVGGYAYGTSSYDFALVRYNSDGSLDTTFGTGGVVLTDVGTSSDYAYSMAVGADGKIVLAGASSNNTYYDLAVVRYNSDGSLDTTFGSEGKVITSVGTSSDYAYSVAVQSDGKVVAAGYASVNSYADFALVRYNVDGTLDTTFGGTGKITTAVATNSDMAYAVAVQSDGKIVAAGYAYGAANNNDFALVRYNADGSLDTTFGTGGKVITPIGTSSDYGRAIALQPDGRIVVAGYAGSTTSDNIALARYNTDGTLDATFDGDGILTVSLGSGNDRAYAVILRADGNAFVAGQSYSGTNSDAVEMPLVLTLSFVNLSSASGMQFHIDAIQQGAGQLVSGTEGVFDGMGRLLVGGLAYQPASASYTIADNSHSVVTAAGTVAGLTVSRKITVPSTGSQDVARTIDTFTNNTSSSITTTVTVVGNLGSDGDTVVWKTSDGDSIVEATDLWIGTDDTDGSGTPAIIHYIHGSNGLTPTSVSASGDNITWTYTLTITSGQTVELAYLTIVADTRAAAEAAAGALVTADGLTGHATDYLSSTELASLANFYNHAPTVVTPAGPGAGVTINIARALTVLGDDIDTGESSLTYTWSVTGTPPAPVTFSANGTNAAKDTVVTFKKPGTYTLLVTISDGELSTTSSITVTIDLPSFVFTQPSSVVVDEGQSATNSSIFVNNYINATTITASVGTITQTGATAGYWNWSYSTTDGPAESQTVTITVTDAQGATGTVNFALTVNNLAPSAAISGATTGSVGTALTLNGSATDPSCTDQANLTLAWTVVKRTNSGATTFATGSGTTLTFTPTEGGLYEVRLTATDKDGLSSAAAIHLVTVNGTVPTTIDASAPVVVLQKVLEAAVNSSGKLVTVSTANQAGLENFLAALAGVAPTTAITAQVTLAAGVTYQGMTLSVPANVTLVIDGQNGQVVIQGHSPALTVSSGQVIVQNGVILETSTDDATILVTGGSLTIRNSTIRETTGGTQAAIAITGGTVDLGTAGDAGGNTFVIQGSGLLVKNTATTDVSALRNTWQQETTTLTVASAIEAGITDQLDNSAYGRVNWDTAPTVTVSLDTDAPYTSDTLTATATATDVDGNLLTLTYEWRVNGTVVETVSGTSSRSDTFDLSLAGHGEAGDVITVTVTASDGTLSSPSASDTATVAETAVVGRYTFYNNSYYGTAIATDKVALLPGETASFVNVTSYRRGLNGIMIDVAGLAHAAAITADDLTFRVGNDTNPLGWNEFTLAPKSVTVGVGQGAHGSDRIVILWADYNPTKPSNPGAAHNQWLEVTVKATTNSGLSSPDVFYFGNLIGETGFVKNNFPGEADVTVSDIIKIQNQVSGDLVDITNLYDIDRSGMVVPTDIILCQNQVNQVLYYFTAPSMELAAEGEVEAMTIPSLTANELSPIVAQTVAPLTPNELSPTLIEAVARWVETGLDTRQSALVSSVQVVICDLPDAYLGAVQGTTIYLDTTAAGHGWFVDPTPDTNEEFTLMASTKEWTVTHSPAATHYDLLTVVFHELGHVLGLEDVSATTHHLMSESLPLGTRRLPQAAEVDALFGHDSLAPGLDSEKAWDPWDLSWKTKRRVARMK